MQVTRVRCQGTIFPHAGLSDEAFRDLVSGKEPLLGGS